VAVNDDDGGGGDATELVAVQVHKDATRHDILLLLPAAHAAQPCTPTAAASPSLPIGGVPSYSYVLLLTRVGPEQ
jgi:hypothetical protein